MNKKTLPLFIVAALAWFGYHCGAGFASGRQVWLYAVQYGRVGLAAPIIIWIANSIFMYISAEYQRLRKTKSYKEMVTIYYDNPVVNRVALFLWDVLVFMAAVTVSSSCTAGTGSLLNNVLGLPYGIGCAIFVIGMACLLSFGQSILERLGKFGIPLIIVFFAICLVAIFSHPGTMVSNIANAAPVAEITKGAFFKKCMVYAITQCSFFQALAPLAGRFESRKESVCFAITGFVMNCGAMYVAYLAEMAFYPGCGESTIPLYAIGQSFTGILGALLMVAYYAVLILSYITTAGGALAGAQARYTPVLIKYLKTDTWCRITVTVVFLVGAALLSKLGLDGILTTVNTINSTCRLPVWFLPFLILGPISISKLRKKELAEKAK